MVVTSLFTGVFIFRRVLGVPEVLFGAADFGIKTNWGAGMWPPEFRRLSAGSEDWVITAEEKQEPLEKIISDTGKPSYMENA